MKLAATWAILCLTPACASAARAYGPGDLPEGSRAFLLDASALVVPEPTGDFDRDRDVDGTDLLTWQRHQGGSGDLSQGDADGDGNVTAADLASGSNSLAVRQVRRRAPSRSPQAPRFSPSPPSRS